MRSRTCTWAHACMHTRYTHSPSMWIPPFHQRAKHGHTTWAQIGGWAEDILPAELGLAGSWGPTSCPAPACLAPGPGSLGPGRTPVRALPLPCLHVQGRPPGPHGCWTVVGGEPRTHSSASGPAAACWGRRQKRRWLPAWGISRATPGRGGRCTRFQNRCSLRPHRRTHKWEALVLGNQRGGRSEFCAGDQSGTASVVIL